MINKMLKSLCKATYLAPEQKLPGLLNAISLGNILTIREITVPSLFFLYISF